MLAAVLLVTMPTAAQDVVTNDGAGIVSLTVGEVSAIVMGLVALLTGVVAVVRTWTQTPGEARTWGELDRGIASRIDQQARDREFMATVEKLVDSQNRAMQASLREVSEVVLKAAMWQPSAAVQAGARALQEATDGVPLATKSVGDADPDAMAGREVRFGQLGDLDDTTPLAGPESGQ